MPYWYSRRSRGGKSTYRKYYRSKYKRYYRKKWRYAYRSGFINGSSKSQIKIKIPISWSTGINKPAGAANTNVALLSQPWRSSGYAYSAISSELYRTYTQLYEEVRCIGTKLRIAITTPIGGSDIPSLKIYTAWDRRLAGNEMSSPPTFEQLQKYATSNVVTAVNNSVAKMKRSLYASDLIERAQWHDCTLITQQDNTIADNATISAQNNPNFFSPGLWIAFETPGVTAAKTINFSVDYTYYFAFRNPKYGMSAGAAKSAEMRAIEMPEGVIREREELPDEDIEDEEDEEIIVPVKKKATTVRK